MAKKQLNQKETAVGRISLLLFWLILFWGILRLERLAHYRKDLILHQWTPWLLPTLFGVALLGFVILLFLWIKGGKKESTAFFSLPFLMIFPLTLAIGFLVPWLMNFMPGMQFFRLGARLVFYAAVGGYVGYIGYYLLGKNAAPMAAALTADCLALFYFYTRFLSASSFILNTAEFGYLPAGWAAAILIALLAAVHLLLWLPTRKQKPALRPLEFFLPGGIAALLLVLNAVIPFGITPIRWMIFGGIGAITLWYIAWCLLKKKHIL